MTHQYVNSSTLCRSSVIMVYHHHSQLAGEERCSIAPRCQHQTVHLHRSTV